MVKILGIEDHLLNQINKYNGIECLIEDFTEKNYQFGIIDERKPANMIEIIKSVINHSKMESISLNCEVKSKIKQVTINTRRTRNNRKQINVKLEKREKNNSYVLLVLIIL